MAGKTRLRLQLILRLTNNIVKEPSVAAAIPTTQKYAIPARKLPTPSTAENASFLEDKMATHVTS